MNKDISGNQEGGKAGDSRNDGKETKSGHPGDRGGI